jgi:predicted O-methyltransferase YrrM
MRKIKHTYQSMEGWFNMENEYLELLEQCPDGGTFVELGCFKGKSTSFIVTEIINQNRPIDFVAVDSFEGATDSNDNKEVEAYKEISDIEKDFDKNTKLISHNFSKVKSLSHEAANLFEDSSVDICFIDAGHSYEAVKKDIESWLAKMKKGGIISGHDYTAWEGVNKAVNELLGTPDKISNDCWFKKVI